MNFLKGLDQIIRSKFYPPVRQLISTSKISSLHAAAASSAAVFNHLFHLDCRAAHYCKQHTHTRPSDITCLLSKSTRVIYGELIIIFHFVEVQYHLEFEDYVHEVNDMFHSSIKHEAKWHNLPLIQEHEGYGELIAIFHFVEVQYHLEFEDYVHEVIDRLDSSIKHEAKWYNLPLIQEHEGHGELIALFHLWRCNIILNSKTMSTSWLICSIVPSSTRLSDITCLLSKNTRVIYGELITIFHFVV